MFCSESGKRPYIIIGNEDLRPGSEKAIPEKFLRMYY